MHLGCQKLLVEAISQKKVCGKIRPRSGWAEKMLGEIVYDRVRFSGLTA